MPMLAMWVLHVASTPAPAPPDGTGLVMAHDAKMYLGADEEHIGRTELTFQVPSEARLLEVVLVDDLNGARVDVTGSVGDRRIPILRERRFSGKVVRIVWDFPDVTRVTVSVHQHLRPRPVVETFWVGLRLGPS